VIMNRPTKSHGLYGQCLGRGLRLAPKKTECLIIDMVYDGHSLKQAYNLKKALGNDIPEAEEDIETIKDRQIRKMTPVAMMEQEIDLVNVPSFPWFMTFEDDPSIIFCATNS